MIKAEPDTNPSRQGKNQTIGKPEGASTMPLPGKPPNPTRKTLNKAEAPLGQIPPQNLEAEQSTLGSMMIDQGALEKGIDILTRSDFYREAHGEIFDALAGLFKQDKPADIVVVQEALRGKGRLDSVGGTEYLAALIDSVPTSANVEYYASIVHKKAILRRLIDQSAQTIHLAHGPVEHPADVIRKAQQELLDLSREAGGTEEFNLPAVLSHAELVQGELPPVEWTVLNLIPKGGISIIGGDSGVGKSWLTEHLAQCVASGQAFLGMFSTQPCKVLVLDAESGPSLLKRRMMKLFTGLQAENPDGDIPADLPVSIFPAAMKFKPDTTGQIADYLKREGIGLVICDPLIHFCGTEENSAEGMAGFFEAIRDIAKASDTTWVFTHHSRKESRLAPNAAGQMLRGSSAIRGILDSHLFIRRLKGTHLLVEHDKCRCAEPVAAFVVAVEDTDDQTTVCRYVGEAEENCEKTALAADCVLRTLVDAGGAMARKDIIQQAKANNFAVRTTEDALARLLERKEVTNRKVGRNTIYELSGLAEPLFEEAE